MWLEHWKERSQHLGSCRSAGTGLQLSPVRLVNQFISYLTEPSGLDIFINWPIIIRIRIRIRKGIRLENFLLHTESDNHNTYSVQHCYSELLEKLFLEITSSKKINITLGIHEKHFAFSKYSYFSCM